MKRLLATLSAVLVATALAASCSSDPVDDSSSDVVVSGAPLMISEPALATDVNGTTVVIGTLSNVTDRTVEIVSATSGAGDIGFRTSDGSELSSLVVEPNTEFTLALDGTHLVIPGSTADLDSVEVVLGLDIQDQFTFTAQRRDRAETASSSEILETQSVVVAGTPLSVLDDDAPIDAAIGFAAPQVTGKSFDGSQIAVLAEGEPTVVGFFAHWCPHCQQEVDELSDHLAETGLPDDVRVIAVSTAVQSGEANFPPSEWFETEGWPAPVLTDDEASTAAAAYGLSAFPFWVVVDADGEVVDRLAGSIGTSQFDALVEAARSGLPT